MKRQQFLDTLCLLPFLAVAACKQPFPSTPTIVTGKVIDENELPVEDVEFIYGGGRQKGLSLLSTFDMNILTDKEGIYKGSIVVPSDTDFVSLTPISNIKFNISRQYEILILTDGKYQTIGNAITINRKNYGSTNTFNFQIRKI